MNKMIKNMLVFTLALGVITILYEFFKKGELKFEEPVYFFLSIVVLGTVGGYIFTWAYDDSKK